MCWEEITDEYWLISIFPWFVSSVFAAFNLINKPETENIRQGKKGRHEVSSFIWLVVVIAIMETWVHRWGEESGKIWEYSDLVSKGDS